jgi:hypothetical protein
MSEAPATLRLVFSHAVYQPGAVEAAVLALDPSAGAQLQTMEGATALELPATLADAELLLAELANRVLALSVEMRGV